MHEGPSAYSNLVTLPNGNLAILFEGGVSSPYEGIVFKELPFGRFEAGRARQPTGTPDLARVRDFPGDAIGKAVPYGVYDMARNEAWVSVGRDPDTPAFAVASIRLRWTMMGRQAYRQATALFVTADAGGSNGYRSRG